MARARTEEPTQNSIEQLLLAALERPGDELETGRYLVTFRQGALEGGIESLRAQGMSIADARDFPVQAAGPEDVGAADALLMPEIGVALITGAAAAEREFAVKVNSYESDGPIEVIEPERFVFAENHQYLRGFARAATTIARDLGLDDEGDADPEDRVDAEVLGATWGLMACRVPPSLQSGRGIKVAVLDTGMDLMHPDFAGRMPTSNTFVGQPVHDLHGHGTHCIGTATGPLRPPGTTPRYGIAHHASIFVGKVLTNSGSGTGGSVLAGLNWAIANRCQVISMSLGSQGPVQMAYTNAGTAALRAGCLVIAAAGNAGSTTGSPANSPTIMSVASLDPNLRPSSFSNFGKIDIAAPGRDVLSSWPRPTRYRTISGTSMATPHVAGCAALWASSSPALRGQALWRQLCAAARRLPLPSSRVGCGLVQAP